MDSPQSQCLFSRLPPELRLEIYKLLLLHCPDAAGSSKTKPGFLPVPANYFAYETGPSEPKPDRFTLSIRAEDPGSYELRVPKHARSAFMIRSGSMRAGCMGTTYFPLSNSGIYTSLLLANAQIHAEAAEVLYASHTFDFDTHIEALVAFLSDLTPFARNCVRSIRLVKRALPYEKEYDRAEWATAMDCLGRLGQLKSLSLGILAGKPGPDGWDMIPAFKKEHFDFIKETEGMEWIQGLLKVRDLDELKVDAVVEHCPVPRSAAMARYIQFSASIEGSFAEFLQEHMVVRA